MKKRRTTDLKRKGMSLALTLVILLVAGAMVAVSFVFIENMRSTSEMKTTDEFLVNAALDGLERGKTWVYERIEAKDPPVLTAAGAISSVSENFKELLVTSGDVVPNPTLQFSVEDVRVEVRIYDLGYDYTESLEFKAGMPPMLYKGSEGVSLKAGQSYASSNVGEGDPGAASPQAKILKAYLVRSEVKQADDSDGKGRSKFMEQALFVKP